jgi:hypothetical protein
MKDVTREEVMVMAGNIKDTIYNYGKAKISNILEATMEPGPQLQASKRLVSDLLNTLGDQINTTIHDTLLDESDYIQPIK